MTRETKAAWPTWLPSRLLTIEDVAEILQANPRTVRRMIDAGKLGRVPGMGRLVRVRPEDLLALLSGQQRTEKDNSGQDKYGKERS